MAANNNNADSRHHPAEDAPAPPSPIPKDMQGSNNPVPLSPQWRQPKPGDNKLGMVTGESHFRPHTGNRSDVVKTPGNGDNLLDPEKRKGVFRPSFHDLESDRGSRWRDEERETNSTIHRDGWRVGEKEFGGTRRTERLADSSSRHSVEARRAPDRWTDLIGNRENNNDQRRESKWNPGWGPVGKESENRRDKSDFGRDGDGFLDKGTTQVTSHAKNLNNHGKEDGEGEHHYRPWRPNSIIARGRGATSQYPALMPNKQTPVLAYGRGRGENTSVFSVGRGRFNSSTSMVNCDASHSYSLGAILTNPDSDHGDPSAIRYNRMKLLEIYKMTDVKSYRMALDGFIKVTSLTLEEPLEPLAFSPHKSDELDILQKIDKGDVVSSGVSKDGSVGRSSTDSVASKQRSIEDQAFYAGGYTDEVAGNVKGDQSSYLECPSYEKHSNQLMFDAKVASNQNFHSHQDNMSSVEALKLEDILKVGEAGSGDMNKMESSSTSYNVPWRSQSVGEHSLEPSCGSQGHSIEHRSSDIRCSDSHKDVETDRRSTVVSTSYYRDEFQRQNNEDPFVTRNNSASRNFQPNPLPEELSLFYKDPMGQIQGPFSGSDMIGWFEAGYFGIDLPVCLASASTNAPFSLLGDVMPHLRMKTRPPPGFAVAKQNDAVQPSSRGKFGSFGNINASVGEFTNRWERATNAENQFLEPLLSPSMNSSSSEHFSSVEGVQGYTTSGLPLVGADGGDMNYLLSQRMLPERPKSFPNPLPYWQGREPSSMPKTVVAPESPTPHSKLLPQVAGTSYQNLDPQHLDLLSVLQAASVKSPSAANSAAPIWSNFPEVRPLNNTVTVGMDSINEKMDMHNTQHLPSQAGFVGSQPRLQAHNQPSLPHMITHPGDFSSGSVPPEKLLSSDISKDPQLSSLLQQQYLLSQLQLHSLAPLPSQLSFLDKLLLKHQQDQQQQQILLQQQQHLLSQVLSGHHSHQYLGEQSYGHLKAAAMPTGNAPMDHHGRQELHNALQINKQTENLNLLNEYTSDVSNLNLQAPQDFQVSLAPSLPLPHQLFEPTGISKETATFQEEIESTPTFDLKPSLIADNSILSEALEKSSAFEILVSQKNAVRLDDYSSEHKPSIVDQSRKAMQLTVSEAVATLDISEGTISSDLKSSPSKQADYMSIFSESIPEECQVEPVSVKGVKNAEARELKKTPEKKSKKQKNPKALVPDIDKASSKTILRLQPNLDISTEGASTGGAQSDILMEAQEHLSSTSMVKVEDQKSALSATEPLECGQSQSLSMVNMSTINKGVGKSISNLQNTSSRSAWKPAPGFKAKSLREIQEEEQRRAQTERVASDSAANAVSKNSSSTPWAGVVTKDALHGSSSSPFVVEKSDNSFNTKAKKSQLHDLLAEEVLKSEEVDTQVSDDNTMPVPSLLQMDMQLDIPTVDFAEARDTKKTRKKSGKLKGAELKGSSPVSSPDISNPLSVGKAKSTRQLQLEKEVIHVPPEGPSLGDFPWKGGQIDSTPAPAWSVSAGKVQKTTPLRDIQKEQERKRTLVQQQIPVPAPAKLKPNHESHGSGSSWKAPGSSPSNAAPIQTNSLASVQSNSRIEDDLFWGSLDQTKHEIKQSGFPSLENCTSTGVGVTSKGAVGTTRQKPSSSKPQEYALSSSPSTGVSLSKGRKYVTSLSEAMEFRDWCERESVRLLGTNDTSFLEFCLTQSTSEAELLLKENLGSMDRNHEFIDKFLNYKSFLSSDVLETAFQTQNRRTVGGGDLKDSKTAMIAGVNAGGGGKKKTKKGKKVSPLDLGFNVASSRMMMGEIQTIEE